MTAPTSNWDGHEFDPAGKLSLPERIVHRAEQAILERSATVFRGITGVESVEGYPTDLAKAAAEAALLEYADEHAAEIDRCTIAPLDCGRCRRLTARVEDMRRIAAAVSRVPALKAV